MPASPACSSRRKLSSCFFGSALGTIRYWMLGRSKLATKWRAVGMFSRWVISCLVALTLSAVHLSTGVFYSGHLLAASRALPVNVGVGIDTDRAAAKIVSGNYFDVLNVKAIRGRTFLPEEDKTKLSHPVIVVGYDCWQRRFAGDPDLVGKDVLINNHQFRVIGIAPEGFKGTEFVYSPEIWLPASMITSPGSSTAAS